MAALAEIYSDSIDDKQIVDFIFLELQVTVPPAICVTYSLVDYGRPTSGADTASLKTVILSGDAIL